MAFYTATNEYDAHVPALSVTVPDKTLGFHSETLRFLNPASEPLEAVVIAYAQTDAPDRCTQHAQIGPVSTHDNDEAKAILAGLDPLTLPIVPLKVLGSGSAPSCAKPYVKATIDGQPVQPNYPGIAQTMGATGVVLVRVALNADGSIASVSLYKSSGFEVLDRSALQAAASTHYLPEIFRCEPIAGTYLYTAEFGGR